MTENAQDRIQRIKKAVMQRKGSFVSDLNPFLTDTALWRATKPGRGAVEVRAGFLPELVKGAAIEIPADWTLAGEHLLNGAVEFGFCSERYDPAEYLPKLGVAPEDAEEIKYAVESWVRPKGTLRTLLDGDEKGDRLQGGGYWGYCGSDMVYWAGGWVENHSVRDFAKVLRIGFGGIRREVQELLEQSDLTDPEFALKVRFWKAALSVCDAGILLGKRYAQKAAELAEQTNDPSERQRFQQMVEVCSRVPAEGARTFFEATQALWFAHILTCGEDGINANSIGRLDQILYPWYQADMQAGRLTRQQAVEVMEELACKLYLDYDVQAICLGGLKRDGSDATNELSYIILEATENVGFIRDVSIRVHDDTPADFVDLASRLIVKGGGVPFIFNDNCFVKALADRGIAIEDARDYAPIGCIELTIPGRANPHAVSGWLNAAKCLEFALYDGVDHVTGKQVGAQTGSLEEMKSFEEFFDAYCKQVEYFASRMVYGCNRGELAQQEAGPLPCWSVMTDDCIQRGRDITDGGAVYNYHSVCFLGTANTADSLMAVKKLVFDEKRITAAELCSALQSNFENAEPLRQMLLQDAPKYGNDCAEVDKLARRIDEHFIAFMDGMRSPLGGRYFVHLFSFLCNIHFGKATGATPDGRLAGQPIAYSLSAQQGRDQKGVTAMLKSLSHLPHDQAAGASAAIVEIDPVLVDGPEGPQRMADLIRTAMNMGIGQLQWNVTTVERLREAQQDPERYGNIAVRVAGFSQMFKLLDHELQNHIIARTKHIR